MLVKTKSRNYVFQSEEEARELMKALVNELLYCQNCGVSIAPESFDECSGCITQRLKDFFDVMAGPYIPD